ncbi:hypothetical protein Pmani_018323 [Petrolisthes manimaculis]|nr:hypothetical protein Pmani_032391 [Petrolisthes manimaculis]KAK4310087.1 hypothetical protein Pmani_018323 [Petrolisthes manimaculis]
MQLFPPANRKAVGSDHDYMEYPPEKKYLIDEKISHVTESDRQEIELATRGQDNSKRWKQERGKRIT